MDNQKASHKKYRDKNKAKTKERYRKWYIANREHALQAAKEWKENNPEKFLDTRYKREYGLSLDDVKQIFKSQNEQCAICLTIIPLTHKHTHLDHCHTTNKVRGILCVHCNAMLGDAKDNIQTLKNAVTYLEQHKYLRGNPAHGPP